MDFRNPMEGASWLVNTYDAHVFPVHPALVNGAKKPMVANNLSPDVATNTEEGVKEFSAQFPGCNWGVACGPSYLYVIDIDVKNGKQGLENFRALQDKCPLPETLVVQTPTGGFHHYYEGCGPSTQGDRGGLAPGSSYDGKQYRIVKNLPIAPIPEGWLALHKPAAKVKTKGADNLDTPTQIAQALRYAKKADPAIEGQGGDAQTFKVAQHLLDLGCTPESAYDLLLQFFNPRCVPAWGEEELWQKVENAAKYRQNAPGCRSAEAMFGKVDPAVVMPKAKKKLFLDAAEWAEQPEEPIDPIVEGVFGRGDKAFLIAPSKARKSFLALQFALSVASGREFLGFPVPQARRVAVCQYEVQAKHFHRRLKRVGKNMLIAPKDYRGNLLIANLRGTGATLTDLADDLEDFKPDLVIFDPLYKMYGANHDENAAGDAAALLAEFDRFVAYFGCAVMLIHHDKKGAAGDSALIDRGAGSGLITRDYDAAFQITPHADEEDAYVLSCVLRNYAPRDDVAIRWTDHFAVDYALVPDPETSATRRAKMQRGPTAESIAETVKSWIGNDPSPVAGLKERIKTELGVGERKVESALAALRKDENFVQARDPGTKNYFIRRVR